MPSRSNERRMSSTNKIEMTKRLQGKEREAETQRGRMRRDKDIRYVTYREFLQLCSVCLWLPGLSSPCRLSCSQKGVQFAEDMVRE